MGRVLRLGLLATAALACALAAPLGAGWLAVGSNAQRGYTIPLHARERPGAEGGPAGVPGVADTSAIFGVDERVQVTDTDVYPWSAIAFLELYDEGGLAAVCTGTFIGPDAVITAAHCLYDHEHGAMTGVAVYPGRDGETEPFGFDWASEAWIPEGWIDGGGLAVHDWAVLRMPSQALGNQAGWLPIADLKTDTLSGSEFHPAVSGYPGDQEDATLWTASQSSFLFVGARFLEYTIDTSSGQSGSAVVSGNTSAWYWSHVVGIHTGGGDAFNLAQRVDDELLGDVLHACAVMGCAVESVVESQATPTPTPTPTSPQPPTATGAATPAVATPPGTTTIPPSPTPTRTPLPVLIGDASCDGLIDPIDAAFILQLGAGVLLALPCPQAGDADGNGSVTIIDATVILQYSAGMLSRLPP